MYFCKVEHPIPQRVKRVGDKDIGKDVYYVYLRLHELRNFKIIPQ